MRSQGLTWTSTVTKLRISSGHENKESDKAEEN